MFRNGVQQFRSGYRLFHSSIQCKEPLRIAFFGSDEFSIASLRKLVELSSTDKSLIESIDVIAKHPKQTGRDLKQTKDVLIAEFAHSLDIPVIRAEKKSEILDLIQNNYSLAIAVSYGKLIPQKFIESVKYSLNVHPSLLPKYSGASPLQYALLNNDEFTGVTVQTLHPTEFDKGVIVDQTQKISIEQNETIETLTKKLSIEGANLLSKVLINGSFKNPNFISNYEYSYASKITPEMREIDWSSQSALQIKRQFDALGPLYSFKEIKLKKRRKPLIHEFRRILFFDIKIGENIDGLSPGQFKIDEENNILRIQTSNGSILTKDLQFEFEKIEQASKFIQSLSKRSGETEQIFTKKFNLINN